MVYRILFDMRSFLVIMLVGHSSIIETLDINIGVLYWIYNDVARSLDAAGAAAKLAYADLNANQVIDKSISFK